MKEQREGVERGRERERREEKEGKKGNREEIRT